MSSPLRNTTVGDHSIHPERKKRDRQHQKQRAQHPVGWLAGEAGHRETGGNGEEQRVGQHERDEAVGFEGDAAHQQGQREHGQRGQQGVARAQRGHRKLAEHHVVCAQAR
jgi:hypothetical protein